jgi:queuine tRNA-ribosyltransferase
VRLTPESVVEAQQRLGVDVAMVLDECPPWPQERAVIEAALARTTRWAERARSSWRPSGRALLFGIVQGGFFPELRCRAVDDLAALDFDGYAIGGVSVGEPASESRSAVALVAPLLPEGKPRYLMGVGTPADIAHAVLAGVDLFDCVMPTRNARHGLLYTRDGLLRIKNACFRDDPRPLDPACGCATCTGVSRALLHHLIRSREVTATVLATLHNVQFYLDFMADLRQALKLGTLADSAAGINHRYPPPISRRGGVT